MQSSLIAPLNKKRSGAAAATIDNTVYVFGGYDGSNYLKDGEEYDRRTDKWTLLDQHMSVARSWLAAATVGNAVYLLGGEPSASPWFTDVVECYDCVTNKFTSRKPLPSARERLAAVGVRVSSAALARLTSSSK
jgi:hypothetical protein